MSKYGYFKVFQSPFDFEMTRVGCISFPYGNTIWRPASRTTCYTFLSLMNIALTYYKLNQSLKCLSIGTSKAINFPFAPNGKVMVFLGPNI